VDALPGEVVERVEPLLPATPVERPDTTAKGVSPVGTLHQLSLTKTLCALLRKSFLRANGEAQAVRRLFESVKEVRRRPRLQWSAVSETDFKRPSRGCA
jgi:hypothetical protein